MVEEVILIPGIDVIGERLKLNTDVISKQRTVARRILAMLNHPRV